MSNETKTPATEAPQQVALDNDELTIEQLDEIAGGTGGGVAGMKVLGPPPPPAHSG